MRKVLEVVRLACDAGRSQHEIALALGLAQSTVGEYVRRFRASGLAWPLAPEIDEAVLEARLFARPAVPPARGRSLPDWATVHRELRRKGVTLHLLWQEYKESAADGYQYTQFCRHYHAWAAHLDPVLRQQHTAGERTFVDYAGQTIDVVDPTTGEVREAQLFVGVLGASNYFYAEATWTQALPDWIASHVRMVEDFGGVTALIVPDNLRSGVTHASFYEPTVNATYQDFATYYGTAILPTRVARPRDKAKVESAVLVAERWLLAPLRHHTFTSLADLNREIARLREAANDRPFQKLAGSRRSLFETLDRPALRPLPATRYELAEWRTAKVNIDYHIAVDGHFYSVPYALVRAAVRVRLTASMIEVLHEGKRVATHPRSAHRGRFTTEPAHRPKSHQAHLEWTPSRLVHWGTSIGPSTGALVTRILEHWPHPEQGYRACLGLLSLRKRYTDARLEAACARALTTGATSYKSVKSILAAGLDQLAPEEPPPLRLPATHAHIRGADYYRTPRACACAGTAPVVLTCVLILWRPPMLMQQTLDLLHTLRLTGMAQALEEQQGVPDLASLVFEDRLALLLERERLARGDRRLTRLLQIARFRDAACVEDVNFRAKRSLDRSVFLRLAAGDWIRQHEVILLVGPTGTGKTWLACALGHSACRQGHVVRYVRLPRLLGELANARADGSYGRLLQQLAKTDLLILDDWGLAPLGDRERRDLLEVIEDRSGRRATLVTSQVPVDHWHELVGDATFGDAILDRLVHHAHRITLTGGSLRKLKPAEAASPTTESLPTH